MVIILTITLEDEDATMSKIRELRHLLTLTWKVDLCYSSYRMMDDAEEDVLGQFKKLIKTLRELICFELNELFFKMEPFASIDDPITKSMMKV